MSCRTKESQKIRRDGSRRCRRAGSAKIKETYLCMYVCACDEATLKLDAVDVVGTMELLLEMAGGC